MIDEKLIKEKLESYKEGIQKLNKPYMKKHISPNQFCNLMNRLIEYIETNKECECEHEWIPCGLTTIRNPTVIKSSLSNGKYILYECKNCGEHRFEHLKKREYKCN